MAGVEIAQLGDAATGDASHHLDGLIPVNVLVERMHIPVPYLVQIVEMPDSAELDACPCLL